MQKCYCKYNGAINSNSVVGNPPFNAVAVGVINCRKCSLALLFDLRLEHFIVNKLKTLAALLIVLLLPLKTYVN